jgi:alkanesulfonate monooxygenase SsuD/methylene tetrahydromethanopterin reductase-like flavin-dependent oxidoreductase (luciferase family)
LKSHPSAREALVSDVPQVSVFPLGEGMAFEQAREIWREAERLGFPAIWHEDNVFPHPTELLDRRTPILDCWTALAALAASTSTIRLGSMVTPAPRRHPALLARAASTVDHISSGRLTIGIGAGDPSTVEHYTQWGMTFPATPRERVALLREHLQVQKLLYTQDVASFEGEHFTLRDAVNSPKPVQRPHPPIWIGMNTNAVVMPKVAAELADGVVVEWGDDEVAGRVAPRLVEACERLGRDPAEVTTARHLGVVVTTEEMPAERVFTELARRSGFYDPARLRETWDTWLGAIVGPPGTILEPLRARTIELGFSHAMVHVLSLGFEEDAGGLEGIPGSTFAGLRRLAKELGLEERT